MSFTLHSEISGPENDHPIIILHGLFGSSSNWRSVARSLAQDYRVYLLDLRNHGKSPWRDDMGYQHMALDVAGYIESNKIKKPTIIGHSMGGKTAMVLAQSRSHSLGKIFVVDIAPVSYQHDHAELLDAMLSVPAEDMVSRSQVDNHLAKSIGEVSLRQFLMQNLVRDDNQFRWRLNLDSIVRNLPDLLDYPAQNTVQNEVIFISGKNSDYITPEYHQRIKILFPNSSIEYVEDAGHWLHAEKPKEFLEIILRHIEAKA